MAGLLGNTSVFNSTQNDERQAAAQAEADAFARQASLFANIPVDYTGNINLANRPQVQMPDGSVATVRSMSFNDNGQERLIPTVSQSGQLLSPEQAIAEYRNTGQHLGVFDTPEAATAMAQRIHEQQASGYGTPAPAAPTAATQAAAQGAATATRKLTPEEYQMSVIRDLMLTKGYSYDEAAELMAPYIGMYKLQDAADKKQQAEALAAQLNGMPIDSNEYRAGVLKLAQLDPTMAKFYAGDMVTRKDLWNRQNKLDDLAAAHQWQEYMRTTYGRGGRGGGGGGGRPRSPGRPRSAGTDYGDGWNSKNVKELESEIKSVNDQIKRHRDAGQEPPDDLKNYAIHLGGLENSARSARRQRWGFGSNGPASPGTAPSGQPNAGGLFTDAALRSAFNLAGGNLGRAEAEKVAAVAQAQGMKDVTADHVMQQWNTQDAENDARVAAEAEAASGEAVDPDVANKQAREEAQNLGLYVDRWSGEVSPAGPYDHPTEQQLARYREWAGKWRR